MQFYFQDLFQTQVGAGPEEGAKVWVRSQSEERRYHAASQTAGGDHCLKIFIDGCTTDCDRWYYCSARSHALSNKLMTPVFLGSDLLVSKQINVTFSEGKSRDSCCIDSSNYLQLIGNECSNLNIKNGMHQSCIYSDVFVIKPCRRIHQEHTKFCKYPNLDCTLSSTFLSLCDKKTPLKDICDVEDFDCDKVTSTTFL